MKTILDDDVDVGFAKFFAILFVIFCSERQINMAIMRGKLLPKGELDNVTILVRLRIGLFGASKGDFLSGRVTNIQELRQQLIKKSELYVILLYVSVKIKKFEFSR